jgi:hypothetical protein
MIRLMLGANAVVEYHPEGSSSQCYVVEQRSFDMREPVVAPVSEACSQGAFEGYPVAFRLDFVELEDAAG